MKAFAIGMHRFWFFPVLFLLANGIAAQGQPLVDFSSLPKTKNLYHIKAPASKKSLALYQQFQKKIPEPRLINKDDSLWLFIGDGIVPAKKFFSRRRDGFALEIISFDQYQCENEIYTTYPCRRNRNSLLSGTVLKPFFRKYILRHLLPSDAKTKPVDFLINIGPAPKNRKEIPDQVNLLVLKRRRVVDVWHFNTICAEPIMMFQPILPLIDLKETIKQVNYQPSLSCDTLKMFIPFERNDISIPSIYTDHLRYFVSRPNREIIHAQVMAYASVEGSSVVNRKLYSLRAEPLLRIIREHADTTTMISENTKENWNLFFRQIKNTPDTFLIDLDTIQIRKFVNDTAYSGHFDSILDQERYSSVMVISRPKVGEINIDSFAVDEYGKITETALKNYGSGKWNGFPPRVKTRLADIQLFLFQRYLNGKIPYQTIQKLTLKTDLTEKNSKEKLFEPLLFNRLYFEYLHFKDRMDHDSVLQYLRQLRKYREISPAVLYNYHAMLINHGSESLGHFSELQADLTRMENSQLDMLSLDKLRLYLYHQYAIRCYDPFSSILRAKARASNMFLFRYYSKEKDSRKRILVANHLVAFDMYKQALDMLQPLVSGILPDHEAVKLRLLILYSSWHGKKAGDFYDELMKSAEILSPQEWCGLFTNTCGLNFQLLDYEPLWALYCKKKTEAIPELLTDNDIEGPMSSTGLLTYFDLK